MRKRFKTIRQLLQEPENLGEKIHENSKIKKASPDEPYQNWPKEWKKHYYKSYVRFTEIALPKPETISRVSLHQALSLRQSNRSFSTEKLTLRTLSTLLYYAAGEKDARTKRRFYPSAGGRYPLEVYLIAKNTELPQGVYHYYVRNHSLEVLRQKPILNLKSYFTYPWMKDASCVVVITSVFERSMMKYENRGYRYILQEVGHMCQNLYLVCASQKINCCSMGGFVDDKINLLLDVDGVKEATVQTMGIG